MLKTLNLKEAGAVDMSIALLEMEIENANLENVSVLKLVHGYGSHGSGGVILSETRRSLLLLKKQGKIKNFFGGDKWNLFDKDTLKVLEKDKQIVGDCDLNKNNPGITIVIL